MSDTTWSREPDSHAGRLFDGLLASVRPFVDAAAPSAPSDVERFVVRVYPGDPIIVDVVCETGGGSVKTFRSTGTGETSAALAGAVGDLLTAGLNRLPVSARQQVAALSDAGGVLRLDLDPEFGSASAFVMATGRPDQHVFDLMSGGVH